MNKNKNISLIIKKKNNNIYNSVLISTLAHIPTYTTKNFIKDYYENQNIINNENNENNENNKKYIGGFNYIFFIISYVIKKIKYLLLFFILFLIFIKNT
tara:strand:- start:11 stop:307 length:297 start_codon:yes stop_codon:yes gene_type:complete